MAELEAKGLAARRSIGSILGIPACHELKTRHCRRTLLSSAMACSPPSKCCSMTERHLLPMFRMRLLGLLSYCKGRKEQFALIMLTMFKVIQ